MKEKGQKISGLRARAIEASLVVPFLVAACGGDNKPATQTPVLPTEQPTPSMVLPSATPEITPAPTPTPEITPAPSLLPITTLFEGKATKPDTKEVTSEIKSLITKYPTMTQAVDEQSYFNAWNGCYTGKDQAGDSGDSVIYALCRNLILRLNTYYKETNDPAFYKVEKEIYNQAVTTLTPEWIDQLKAYLTEHA